MQQLLMRFAGALNRRRAYAATHPMVLAAEEQLLEATRGELAGRSTLTIGIARHELMIDGAPFDVRSGVARELASRLHRRGVGSVTFESSIALDDLRAGLAWMARDAGGVEDVPPETGALHITRTAYDLLILDDAIRDAQSAIASLWRVLAEVAGVSVEPVAAPAVVPDEVAGLPLLLDEIPDASSGFDTDAILSRLKGRLRESTVARRTAVALMELTNHGMTTTDEGRELIGDQLLSLLERLGSASLDPIVKSLADVAAQQRFVTQTIEVLPVGEAVAWLNAAASAREQQISHSMIRLMSKLSTVADDRGDPVSETAFRDAARELVQGWTLPDPNPEAHVELLDRIAGFERSSLRKSLRRNGPSSTTIESSRLLQMALELDVVGEDTVAAVESLVATGNGRQVMQWIHAAGATTAARELRAIATSDRAVRQLLLTEPVDRLEARALLEELDVSAADTLIDVLGEAATKGTRLLVRQRLAEFGDAITPRLIARLGDGPWYLIRNVLSLLHDSVAQRGGEGAAVETIAGLLTHAQVQVRVEALRVLARMDGDHRRNAISQALRDDNERVVVVALQELADTSVDRGGIPSEIIPQLMALVDSGAHSDPVRARAIRTLSPVCSAEVRDWLLRIVSKRTMILRRVKLVEPTQSAVSALHVLNRVYGDDPAAARVLTAAKRVSHESRWQVRDTGSSVERAT